MTVNIEQIENELFTVNISWSKAIPSPKYFTIKIIDIRSYFKNENGNENMVKECNISGVSP